MRRKGEQEALCRCELPAYAEPWGRVTFAFPRHLVTSAQLDVAVFMDDFVSTIHSVSEI